MRSGRRNPDRSDRRGSIVIEIVLVCHWNDVKVTSVICVITCEARAPPSGMCGAIVAYRSRLPDLLGRVSAGRALISARPGNGPAKPGVSRGGGRSLAGQVRNAAGVQAVQHPGAARYPVRDVTGQAEGLFLPADPQRDNRNDPDHDTGSYQRDCGDHVDLDHDSRSLTCGTEVLSSEADRHSEPNNWRYHRISIY